MTERKIKTGVRTESMNEEERSKRRAVVAVVAVEPVVVLAVE